MAFTLAMLYPARVGKLGILAGFAPDGTEDVLEPGSLKSIQAFVSHGTKDDRIPIAQAGRTTELLKIAGAQVVYCESDMGHKLAVDCLRALEKHLALIVS